MILYVYVDNAFSRNNHKVIDVLYFDSKDDLLKYIDDLSHVVGIGFKFFE